VQIIPEQNPLTGVPFESAHTGISIVEAESGKQLFAYNSNKYFVPASNTKLFTLFAALTYLKDSVPGMQYNASGDTVFLYPTGDPTFLQPEFKKQRVMDFLKSTNKPLVVVTGAWKDNALGKGWSWDDYNADYSPERSLFPVFGNLVRWNQVSQRNTQPEVLDSFQTFVYSDPEVNWKVRFREDPLNKNFYVERKKDENVFEVTQGKELQKVVEVPFITNGVTSALELLKDTVGRELTETESAVMKPMSTIYSQPLDSLLQKTMFRSDNFYAEQLLLMVSNMKFGMMNNRAIIDTLLKSELAGLPQMPAWVEGSGLSRYNLFTPDDFVWLLNKLQKDFTLARLKNILPGAGKGTLAGYYLQDSGYIYAKTGTLTGQLCLSGYLISRKNKLLLFSVMVNNHRGNATEVRRKIETFLHEVREKN
jgi:D-alanyl-D-alanine carboxypeptidase/D-alanyl-D-alanine-endopeptidase (penicillin-binding protein 4)